MEPQQVSEVIQQKDGEICTEKTTGDDNDDNSLMYGVEETPPVLTTIGLAFQNLVLAFGGCVVASFTLADLGCAGPDHPIRSKLFCSSLFMVGVTTALQSAIGIRLPVLQGSSGSFLVPLVALSASGVWKCPDVNEGRNTSTVLTDNETVAADPEELLYTRLRELQGSLMSAAVTEMLIGATGIIGILLRFIRPISIAATITLLGLTLAPIPVKYCHTYWPAAIVTVALLTIFSAYLSHIAIPLPRCGAGVNRSVTRRPKFPLFQLFSILMATLCGWLFCYVLTVTDVLPNDPSSSSYLARTDSKLSIVTTSPWFSWSYPGQFGSPSFNFAAFLGYLSAFAASEMESVGFYMSVAKECNKFPPPNHAVNRGIMLEGMMAILSGAVGTGLATTSYTDGIAIVKFTKVASRSVLIVAGVMAIVLSVIGKFGAAMSLIPYPAIGGIYLVICGTITAVGVSTLQGVDMTSSRNTAVFGISVYTGYIFSEWMKQYPNAIDTGTEQVDQILKVFLGTPMFLGSIVSVFLDNTIPDPLRRQKDASDKYETTAVHHKEYDFRCVQKLQKRFALLRYIPFLQQYRR